MRWLLPAGLLLLAVTLSPWPWDHGLWALILLAVVALEYWSVALPGYGWFSGAVSVWVAAAGSVGLGITAAASFLVAGSLIRLLNYGLGDDEFLYREVTVGSGALAAACLVPGALSKGLVTALVCSLGVVWLSSAPPWFRNEESFIYWNRTQLQIRWLRFWCVLAGVGFVPLFDRGIGPGLLLLSLLFVFPIAAENAVFRVFASEAHEAVVLLTETRRKEQLARKALGSSERRRKLLESFVDYLAGEPGLLETYEAIANTARQLCAAEQVVVVSQDARFREHPLVKKARSTGASAIGRQGSTQAMAIPFDGGDILFLSADKVWAKKTQERDLLYMLKKGEVALQAARRQQTRQQRHYALSERLALLDRLNRGTAQLTSSLDPEAIVDALHSMVEETVPHDAGFVVTEAGLQRSWGPSPGQRLRLQVQALGETGERHQLALPDGELPSWLVVPLGDRGWMAVGSEAGEAYSQEHLDLLSTISFQATVTLANARSFAEVVAARKELEEKQAQLVQSSKMTAVGTMVAGVAHELNTPLGAITLAMEAAELQISTRPEEAARKLDVALQAAERMQELVDRLLVYSRHSAGDRQEPVQLHAVVENALDLARHRADPERFRVLSEVTPVTAILGKASELQQVLVNLVLNSLEAMEESGKGSFVRCRTGEEDGFSFVTVEDDGPGIPAEILNRIFDPFFTTKPVGRNTGLGLSVSHEIVTGHGGSLSVESEVGQGTRFWVRLPVIKESASVGS